MKIFTCVTWDIETGHILSESSYEYSGPLACCDRAAAGQAKQAANQASATGSDFGSQAKDLSGTLVPTLKNEIQNPQGFTPQEKNDMLVGGEQAAGGALGSAFGEEGLQAVRTRNTGSSSGVLDQAMRRNAQNLSGQTLDINKANANLAQQKRGSAINTLESMYGTDVASQLKAMGINTEDINAEIEAGKSGWFQNTLGAVNAAANVAKTFRGGGGGN